MNEIGAADSQQRDKKQNLEGKAGPQLQGDHGIGGGLCLSQLTAGSACILFYFILSGFTLTFKGKFVGITAHSKAFSAQ